MDRHELDSRTALFSGMIACCHNLYLWQYDCGFHLITSNCPQEQVLNNLFSMNKQEALSELPVENAAPTLLTNDVGMMWMTQPLMEEDELVRVFVLGPFFLDDTTSKAIEKKLGRLDMTHGLQSAVREFLGQLPVLSLNRVFEYAIMLHYCITGERIHVSDLRYIDRGGRTSRQDAEEQTDVHGTYKAEQEMIRIVREGDIQHYRAHMERISMTGTMGRLSNGDPLRQMKNAVITCLVLFSRAAMKGGLDPEISYSLSDRYFQSIEACTSIPELREISRSLQEDYIRRVHQVRTGGLSKQVQACCDYISLHLEEQLSLSLLAEHSGYAEYYLSRKFKAETGQSVSEYIRRQRLERAAFLLRTTDEEAQKIAARMQFVSQSRFSEAFKKQFGVTPGTYRAGKQSINDI